MKRYIQLMALFLLFNLGCEKDIITDPAACGDCVNPTKNINIVLRNSRDEDLLYSKTPGYYVAGDIRLYTVESNGNTKDIPFTIRSPFPWGDSNTFRFYQISSPQLVSLVSQSPTNFYYLKIGNNAPKKLELKLSASGLGSDRLLVDDVAAPIEMEVNKLLSGGPIFYINL